MAGFDRDAFLRAGSGGFDRDAFLGAAKVDHQLEREKKTEITPDELYELGSSPESLRAKLNAHGQTPEAPKDDREPWQVGLEMFRADPGGTLNSAGLALGNIASAGVDAATLGAYKKLRDAATGLVAPEASAALQREEQAFEQQAPLITNAARAAGYLSPVGPAAMVARSVGAAVKGLGAAAPALASRPVSGALAGAGIGGGTAAAETASAGGDLGDIAKAGGKGAAVGAGLGAGFGLAGAGLARLGKGANERIDQRIIDDLTDAASATKRDKVVGRGGVKRDRVVETVRRTPELQANTRDPKAAGRVIDQRADDIGGRLDSVYDGVGIPVSDVVDPMLRRAAQLEQNPATRGIAQDLLREAEGVEASWGADGVVNARDVRQYATSLGRTLFRGNPNTDPGLAKSIKQQVYGDIVGSVGRNVEAVKPGAAEELAALNAEMSDLLNMSDVVTHRAAREATPTTRLGDRLHGVMDWGIGIMHPGHLLAKKAAQHFGPGISRAADEFIANSAGAPTGTSLLRESAPLLRALEEARAAERQRDQERARMLGGR